MNGRGWCGGKGWGRRHGRKGKGWCYRGGRGRRMLTDTGIGSIGRIAREFFDVLSKPFRRESPEVIQKAEEIYSLLPKKDCGTCGFESCYECALAIAKGEAPPDACKVVGKKIKDKVEDILR